MAKQLSVVIDGTCLPAFVTEKRLEELKERNPLPGHVYIPSYPKSGSTWVRFMVKLILNNGVDDGVQLLESVKWLEADRGGIESLKDVSVFMTHLSYTMAHGLEPAQSPSKYIYVARNPKDVATSYYHHMLLFEHHGFKGTWDEFFENFMSGDVYYGTWIDHVIDWWKHKDAENILFLKYEDLKKDVRQSIKTIASFIGCPLEPDAVDRILELTSFQAMQKNAAVNLESYITDKSRQFIRKGIVGDWKNQLSEEQSKRIDNEFVEKLAQVGLSFEFK